MGVTFQTVPPHACKTIPVRLSVNGQFPSCTRKELHIHTSSPCIGSIRIGWQEAGLATKASLFQASQMFKAQGNLFHQGVLYTTHLVWQKTAAGENTHTQNTGKSSLFTKCCDLLPSKSKREVRKILACWETISVSLPRLSQQPTITCRCLVRWKKNTLIQYSFT